MSSKVVSADKIEIHSNDDEIKRHRDKYHLSLKLDLQCPSNTKETKTSAVGGARYVGEYCHGVNEQGGGAEGGLKIISSPRGINEQMTFSLHAHFMGRPWSSSMQLNKFRQFRWKVAPMGNVMFLNGLGSQTLQIGVLQHCHNLVQRLTT
jgi:hypothetical protein